MQGYGGHRVALQLLLKRIAPISSWAMVPGCRIGSFSLRKGKVFRAASTQYPGEAKVSFNAARLVIDSVLVLVLLDELLLGGPGAARTGRPLPGKAAVAADIVWCL
jgi:hypothetical protein